MTGSCSVCVCSLKTLKLPVRQKESHTKFLFSLPPHSFVMSPACTVRQLGAVGCISEPRTVLHAKGIRKKEQEVQKRNRNKKVKDREGAHLAPARD